MDEFQKSQDVPTDYDESTVFSARCSSKDFLLLQKALAEGKLEALGITSLTAIVRDGADAKDRGWRSQVSGQKECERGSDVINPRE